jgi:adenylosuccinate lyase
MKNEAISKLWSTDHEERLSFDLWSLHLKWLDSCGWKDALKTNRPNLPIRGSHHRTVDRLRRYIEATGFVNAHFGLTSSDIEDNVRLRQIAESVCVIRELGFQVLPVLDLFDNPTGATPAFTHWQPAGVVYPATKYRSMICPLVVLLENPPEVHAKHFGGPCGDNTELNILTLTLNDKWKGYAFDWSNFGLRPPRNFFPIQSSDHLDEMAYVTWCATIAAQIHKIAADLRFLISVGIVAEDHLPGYRGSSSIPQKSNPYLLEKVCSIMRTISVAPVEMWQVMANNGCERTLDTSWQIRRLLQRVTESLVYGIETLTSAKLKSAEPHLSISIMAKAMNASNQRVGMTLRVIEGEDRISVYEELHKDRTPSENLSLTNTNV